jgi:hypothetical protein
MFKSVAEKTIVGIVSAIAIGALTLVWSYLSKLPSKLFIPPGMIASFNGYCPAEWSQFEAATGRFLIGAGDEDRFEASLRNWDQLDSEASGGARPVPLTIYGVGDNGGEETHLLSTAELPSHDHAQTWGQGNGDKANPQAGKSVETYWMTAQGRTLETGGDQAHNNLPPYVAIRFCMKD